MTEDSTRRTTENTRALLEEPGRMVIEACERPAPGPDEVVIKIARVGVCGSDIHGFRFGPYIPPRPGQSVGLGHEPSGVVAEVGRGVADLKAGDRVCIEPGRPCYTCEFCLSGHYNTCPDVDFMATAPSYRGALTEYLVHPANLVFRLPDELSLDEGALVEPASVATHAVEMAGPLLGRTVVVLGSGAVGLMVSMVARMAGARCVVAVDLQQRRLDKALRLGADAAINAREADVAGRIRQIVGRYGADVVFETAGAVATVELGLAVVKRRGRILVVGTVPGEAPVSLPQDQPRDDHPDGVPLLQQLPDDDRAHALGRRQRLLAGRQALRPHRHPAGLRARRRRARRVHQGCRRRRGPDLRGMGMTHLDARGCSARPGSSPSGRYSTTH